MFRNGAQFLNKECFKRVVLLLETIDLLDKVLRPGLNPSLHFDLLEYEPRFIERENWWEISVLSRIATKLNFDYFM